jgi:hypothetical protein
MILLWAVVIGFFAGLTRAIVAKRRYQAPDLHHLWLVIVAFIPQLFAFRLATTRVTFPDQWIPLVLIGSQAILLVFALLNLRTTGIWLLGFGLSLNLLVIVLNGGMMPISPETVKKLLPDAPPGLWSLGERFGVGKDIVLAKGATNLWFLSDVFVLILKQYRVAFSIGDVLIALGAIWLLWSSGGPARETKEKAR